MAVSHYGFEVPSRLSDAKAQEFISRKIDELRRLVEVCREQRDMARNDANEAAQAEMAELRSKLGWLPRLKPLDWQENKMDRCIEAKTVIGTYLIATDWRHSASTSILEMFYQPKGFSMEKHIGDFASLDDAKGFAWKMYIKEIGKAFT